MEIQLIDGEFSPNDALDLITQMIHVKIKFHENKIKKSENEEDVKSKEAKIKRLQKNLFEIRNNIDRMANTVKINAVLNVEE